MLFEKVIHLELSVIEQIAFGNYLFKIFNFIFLIHI